MEICRFQQRWGVPLGGYGQGLQGRSSGKQSKLLDSGEGVVAVCQWDDSAEGDGLDVTR
jgi:hypothetical protein